MSTFVIGDLQGCHQQMLKLLARIDVHSNVPPSIVFAGDLINRGTQSLATLRHVRALAIANPGRIDSVLGNHDLHLLAVASGIRQTHPSDTLDAILAAPDVDELIDWLRQRPLAILQEGHLIVHAGVLPQWSVQQTLALAHEVEAALRAPNWVEFLRQMFGNLPNLWNDALSGAERQRCVINALTRLRFCSSSGAMDFTMKENAKAGPDSDLMPWFEVAGRKTASTTLVFGHWSALGLMLRPNLICLDSGCVWGGQLSAVCLQDRTVLQVACPKLHEHTGQA